MSITKICLFLLVYFHIGLLLTVRASESTKSLLNYLLSPCKCKCGHPNRQIRLIGGEYLRNHEFPWLALIQIKSERSVPGVLINNKYVLTAASPLTELTPYDIKITVGQFDRCFPDVSSTNISVSRILPHPNYSPGNRANDLALIRLNGLAPLSTHVTPICLSFPGSSYLGQVATAVGWAEKGHGGTNGTLFTTKSSCRPRKLGLPVLGREECLTAAADQLLVGPDKGCIGVIGGATPICEVDAGGPVMFRTHAGIYELIGIFSDRNECNQKAGIALYTSINENLLWITRTTSDACYCTKI